LWHAIVLFIAGGAASCVHSVLQYFFGYRFGKHAEGIIRSARAQAIKVFLQCIYAAAVVLVCSCALWWQHISNQRKAVERLDMQNKNRQQLGERVKKQKK